MSTHTFSIFADYFQFYIQDEPADGDLSESWSREAEVRMLAVAPGTVGIGTVRNLDVPVRIELHTTEPLLRPDDWEHIVECSISIASGKLVVAGCTDYFPEAARLEVSPGSYRVRVCFSGLASVSSDGIDGDDHYHLHLWPGEPVEPHVLKQRGA